MYGDATNAARTCDEDPHRVQGGGHRVENLLLIDRESGGRTFGGHGCSQLAGRSRESIERMIFLLFSLAWKSRPTTTKQATRKSAATPKTKLPPAVSSASQSPTQPRRQPCPPAVRAFPPPAMSVCCYSSMLLWPPAASNFSTFLGPETTVRQTDALLFREWTG